MTFDFSLIPSVTLFLMMLSLGMGLQASDFLRLFKMPGLVCIGVFGQLLVLPILALLVALTMPIAVATGMGLMLLAACPGGATSNMFTRYASGEVALSVTLTAISSSLAPIVVPLILTVAMVFLLESVEHIQFSILDMMKTLISTTLLPIVLGMYFFKLWPAFTEKCRGKLLAFSTIVLVFLIIGLGVNTSRVQPDIVGMFSRSIVAVIVLMLLCFLLVLVFAKLFTLKRKHKITLMLEIGVQNINMALVISTTFLNEPLYLGPTLVYLPLMLLFSGGVIFYSKIQNDKGNNG